MMVYRVLIMPFMGLPYFKAIARALAARNIDSIFSNKIPKRGIIVGEKFVAIHIHMLDMLFLSRSQFFTALRIIYFIFFMAPLLKWRRIRIIWTCHEWAPHEGKGELYCAALGHFMLRVSDHVIVHSTEMLKVVRRKYNAIPRSRLSLLPHGDLVLSIAML